MKLFYLSIIINCSVNFGVCFAGKYLLVYSCFTNQEIFAWKLK